MSSNVRISQADAEAIVRLPTADDSSRLQVKPSPIVVGNGQFLVVGDDAVFDPAIHNKVGTTAGNKEIKGKLSREHVVLLLDTNYKLLVAAVPIPDMAGKHAVENQYRMLNSELSKLAFKYTKSRLAVALANNNIETLASGERQFMLPSALLQEKSTEPRPAKAASTVLGQTAATGAAIAAAAGKVKTFSRAEALDMLLQLEDIGVGAVESATKSILCACHTDSVDEIPGAFLGPTDGMSGDEGMVPAAYMINMDKTPKVVTVAMQQRDLMNHVAVDTKLTLLDKFTVKPGGKDDEIVLIASGQVLPQPDQKSAPAPLPEPTPMAPPPKTAAASSASSSSSNKRKPDAAAATEIKPKAEVPAKRVDTTHADQIKMVMELLTITSTGPLAAELHHAVFGGAEPLGKWSKDLAELPVDMSSAAAAGMQLSELFHSGDPTRLARLTSALTKLRTEGTASLGGTVAEELKTLTAERMLTQMVDPRLRTPLTAQILPLFALQFMAGLNHGYLSTDLHAQAEAIVDKLFAPAVDATNAAEGKVEALTIKCAAIDAELEEAKKKIAQLTADIQAAEGKVTALTAELEAAKAATPKIDLMKTPMNEADIW